MKITITLTESFTVWKTIFFYAPFNNISSSYKMFKLLVVTLNRPIKSVLYLELNRPDK